MKEYNKELFEKTYPDFREESDGTSIQLTCPECKKYINIQKTKLACPLCQAEL